MLIQRMLQWGCGLALTALLVACAQPGPAAGEAQVRYGRINRIDAVQIESEAHLGLGAVIGGVAGGVLGHQFGGGTGRDVATVAGALAGGVAGAQVEKNQVKQPGQHIIVQLNDGVAVGITQAADPNLRVGDRVRIDGSGNGARVVRTGP
ncbi:glycine zipper 2TM domain-containing protein [Variovorax sp. HJSM1_2]|uniref:glycine zipper 2TM domain-containing protein n=1 Tax=Variovorax sp. HJSM1_2 TaxID=3366263 RepID=UPI003BC4DB85